MVNSIQTSLSGLIASSRKIEVASSNIANSQTTGSLTDANNAPYSALRTQLTSTNTGDSNAGVRATAVERDPPFVPAFDPDSPFADTDGYIGAPNVNLGEELVITKEAEFAYKANAQLIKTGGELFDTLIEAVDKDA